MKQLKIVDLFSGLEGWAGPHREKHTVCSVELEERFKPDVCADVRDPSVPDRVVEFLGGTPDIVLASPPCEGFSVLTIMKNWTKPTDDPPHVPKTAQARLAVELVERTFELIATWKPTYFVIENPTAKLRVLPVITEREDEGLIERYGKTGPGDKQPSVTYCLPTLGIGNRKPTDLWGGFPPSLVLPKPCKAIGGDILVIDGVEWRVDPETGEPCHRKAERGSRTGTQNNHQNSAQRAEIPEKLSRLVIEAVERDILLPDPEPVDLSGIDSLFS